MTIATTAGQAVRPVERVGNVRGDVSRDSGGNQKFTKAAMRWAYKTNFFYDEHGWILPEIKSRMDVRA